MGAPEGGADLRCRCQRERCDGKPTVRLSERWRVEETGEIQLSGPFPFHQGVAAREAETTPISLRGAALREKRGYRKNRVTRPRTQLLGLVTPDGGGTSSSRMERAGRR